MKTIKRIGFAIIALLLFGNCLWAKQKVLDSIRFAGSLNEKLKGAISGYVYINYDPDDWFFYAGNAQHLSQKADQNGKFEFRLPDLKKPYKINVLLRDDAKKKLWSGSFYVDSGYDTEMQFVLENGKPNMSFVGKGNEGHQLALDLEKQYWDKFRIKLGLLGLYKIKNVKDTAILSNKIDSMTLLIRDFVKLKSTLIKNASVDSKMKEVLADEFGRHKSEWNWSLFLCYNDNPAVKAFIRKKYLDRSQEFEGQLTKSSIYCPLAITSALAQLARELIISKDAEQIDILDYYNLAKQKYSGAIRDRFIGGFFFSKLVLSRLKPYSPKVMDSLLADAQQFISTSAIKNTLSAERQRLAKINLEKVYDASFIDLNKKKFELKSLRGKIVLIDTWFLGCSACASFHAIFEKEIHPNFKSNKDFVVLSVNIDKKEADWKTGIATKKYTANDYINVTTGQRLGLDHPFLKHYGVKGSPWLMLIDANGNICYQPKGSTVKSWITQISDALNKKAKAD